MAFHGSCLCGTVRYEIDGLDTPPGHCHCATCRKAHAAPFTTTARVARSRFRLLAGAEALRDAESSPGKLRRFCGSCGTHVLAERPAEPHVILRVATLDQDPGLRPAFHIWTAHEVPWLSEDSPAPRHREWPPGR